MRITITIIGFVLLTSIAVTCTARAQSAVLSIRAGATVYDPQADAAMLALSAKEGLVIGGVAELLLLDHLGLRFGLDYALKEATFVTTSGGTGSATGRYTLNYLELPINMKFRFGSDDLGFYVFGGTTLGALLSATSKGSTGDATEADDQLKAVDISADLGTGVDIGLSRRLAALIDITYSFGLLDVAAADAEVLGSWKARTLKAVAGLSYRLF